MDRAPPIAFHIFLGLVRLDSALAFSFLMCAKADIQIPNGDNRWPVSWNLMMSLVARMLAANLQSILVRHSEKARWLPG